MSKYFDDNALSYFWSAVLKPLFEKKQDKAFKTGSTSVYQVLSDNNYSDADKTKLENLKTYTAGNGINITNEGVISSSGSEEVDLSNYYVKSEVDSAIEAVKPSFEIVTELPAVGVAGKTYLVSAGASGSATDSYDEYFWNATDNKFEAFGSARLDLSGYLKSTDIVLITNSDIDTICV